MMETILLNLVKNLITSKVTELTSSQADNLIKRTMTSKDIKDIDKKVDAMKDNAHKSLQELIWGK